MTPIVTDTINRSKDTIREIAIEETLKNIKKAMKKRGK
jgi:hypothetical protein